MTDPTSPLQIMPTGSGFVISGEIDAHTAPDLSAAIANSSLDALRVDMAAVEFVDSSGLRVLVDAHQTMQARGGSLTLVNPSKIVRRLFDVAGVAGYLSVVDELENELPDAL